MKIDAQHEIMTIVEYLAFTMEDVNHQTSCLIPHVHHLMVDMIIVEFIQRMEQKIGKPKGSLPI